VGKRLTSCIRESDMAARLGGDEFTVILPFISSVEDAQTVVEKITAIISSPILLNDTERNVGASIGISFYPDDGDTPDILLQKADDEMYEMKREMKKA